MSFQWNGDVEAVRSILSPVGLQGLQVASDGSLVFLLPSREPFRVPPKAYVSMSGNEVVQIIPVIPVDPEEKKRYYAARKTEQVAESKGKKLLREAEENAVRLREAAKPEGLIAALIEDHQPTKYYHNLYCKTCEEYRYDESWGNADWPCAVYARIWNWYMDDKIDMDQFHHNIY